MRFSEVLAASLLAPLAAAHGSIPGAPKIFGLPKDIKIRDPTPRAVRQAAAPQHGPQLNPRQGGQNGRCGPSFGNAVCATGFCCSGAGYCGTTKDHCAAPDCLIDFGPACDANKSPGGASTRNDARPQKGNVAYGGEGIYSCLKPGTVAITYDDGPYIYTDEVLNKFKAAGFKATFFITGNNLGKGAIDSTSQWSTVIKRMVAEGHQVASHTWSHQDLSVITEQQRYDQMVKNEMAIRNIIGKYPTYMRPPYSSCNAACQGVMKALGYIVSYFDLDTDDYNQLTKEKIQTAKNNFRTGLASVQPATGDRLAIAHDIHELTALNLTTYMIEHLQARGFRGVTMGECMNEPEANWYRTSGGGGGTPTTTTPGSNPTGVVSTDGSCGGSKGFTCNSSPFGNCCSQYGWCGSTTDHCGTGCNTAFGTCGSSTPKPTTTSTPLKTSTDGTCGGSTGNTCVGFVYNGAKAECCSQYGYCGNSSAHCAAGCNPLAGTCSVSTPSLSDSPISEISQSPSVSPSIPVDDQDSTMVPVPTTNSPASSASSFTTGPTVTLSSTKLSVVPTASSSVTTLVTSSTTTTSTSARIPTPTSTVSRDGKCGGVNGQTCKGYTNSFGWKLECCSKQLGRCGNDAWSCMFNCNPQNGKCWY